MIFFFVLFFIIITEVCIITVSEMSSAVLFKMNIINVSLWVIFVFPSESLCEIFWSLSIYCSGTVNIVINVTIFISIVIIVVELMVLLSFLSCILLSCLEIFCTYFFVWSVFFNWWWILCFILFIVRFNFYTEVVFCGTIIFVFGIPCFLDMAVILVCFIFSAVLSAVLYDLFIIFVSVLYWLEVFW